MADEIPESPLPPAAPVPPANPPPPDLQTGTPVPPAAAALVVHGELTDEKALALERREQAIAERELKAREVEMSIAERERLAQEREEFLRATAAPKPEKVKRARLFPTIIKFEGDDE